MQAMHLRAQFKDSCSAPTLLLHTPEGTAYDPTKHMCVYIKGASASVLQLINEEFSSFSSATTETSLLERLKTMVQVDIAELHSDLVEERNSYKIQGVSKQRKDDLPTSYYTSISTTVIVSLPVEIPATVSRVSYDDDDDDPSCDGDVDVITAYQDVRDEAYRNISRIDSKLTRKRQKLRISYMKELIAVLERLIDMMNAQLLNITNLTACPATTSLNLPLFNDVIPPMNMQPTPTAAPMISSHSSSSTATTSLNLPLFNDVIPPMNMQPTPTAAPMISSHSSNSTGYSLHFGDMSNHFISLNEPLVCIDDILWGGPYKYDWKNKYRECNRLYAEMLAADEKARKDELNAHLLCLHNEVCYIPIALYY